MQRRSLGAGGRYRGRHRRPTLGGWRRTCSMVDFCLDGHRTGGDAPRRRVGLGTPSGRSRSGTTMLLTPPYLGSGSVQ